MTPAGRVGLACAVVAAAALLVVSATSKRWFHYHYQGVLAEERDTEWEGFGGPSDPDEHEIALTVSDVVAAVAGFSSLFALGLGLLAAFGTIVGRRRDHVPRLPALLGWSFSAAALAFQALAVAMWPVSKQPEPRGFGWAMPLYFIAAVALLAMLLLLWRDASRRARASADALAKVDRELAAKDLATIPDAEPEELPVERV
jgi:hypothetical protein